MHGCYESSDKDDVTNFNSNNDMNSTEKKEDFLVNEISLLENLQNISKNIRNYNSIGEKQTAEYIKNILSKYEYFVEFQDFEVYKQTIESTAWVNSNLEYLNTNPYNSEPLGNSRNIIITKKDNESYKKTLYITAHYDSTDDTVGIIDNASGSTVVLEIARLLKDYNNEEFNIGFIFFGAEEYCKFGSRYFVSNLSDEEKNNIFGCINIDMVGEKYAGEVVMQTVSGRHNRISLMLDDIFKLCPGGGSDETSFYMGEIPAITLTNENSNPKLALEENQYEYIEIYQLKEICETIAKFINELDISIDNESKIYNQTNFNILIPPISDFKLVKQKQHLLKKGYDSEVEYTYENSNNEIYIIKERDNKFISKDEIDDFTIFDIDNGYGYKIEMLNEIRLVFNIHGYFGEITGDISEDEAIDIMENYYKFRVR